MKQKGEKIGIGPSKEVILKNLSFPESKTITAKLIAVGLVISSIIYGIISILETDSNLLQQNSLSFTILSIIIGFAFLLEYILRVWTSDMKPQSSDNRLKHWEYMKSIIGIIDLICAISFIIYTIALFLHSLIDIARFLRLFAFLKITRYSSFFKIILSVVKHKREELIITLMLSLILLFFGSIFIYIAEYEAQPEVITNLFSSMYFTAVNLFTIGYGEILPITPFGQLISGIVSFLGITLFLLPASVMVSGFLDLIEEKKPASEVCPNCKELIQKSEILRKLENKKKQKMEGETQISKTTKKKINNLIQFRFPEKLGQKLVFLFFMTLITLNILAIMVETNPILSIELRPILNIVLIISIIVFTFEYLLRICCQSIKYFQSLIGIIDLIFLISLYLMIFFNQVTIIMLYLQVLRLFVIFKIGHFLAVFKVAGDIFNENKEEFLVTAFICGIFLVFASTIIYYLERDAQPIHFSSIPNTLWMGIITFTTTGFGDVYPITTAGRFATIALAFVGVAIFTLPAGILGSSFFNTMQDYRYYKICPKCQFVISKPRIRKKE